VASWGSAAAAAHMELSPAMLAWAKAAEAAAEAEAAAT